MSTLLERLQPVGTTQLLDPTSSAAAGLLEELPGNILRTHNRTFASLRFLEFASAESARDWLKAEGSRITTAADQIRQSRLYRGDEKVDGGAFVGIYITHAGARLIGCAARMPASEPFREGQRLRAGRLGDGTMENALADWESPYAQGEFHALLLVAFDETSQASAQQILEKATADNAMFSRVWAEEGGQLYDRDDNSLEHFGHVDGISQTRFLQTHRAAGSDTEWSDIFRLDHVLVNMPAMPDEGELYGSFLVYRKIEQDVAGFARAVSEFAVQTIGAAPTDGLDLARASLVGRFKDGTPLVLQDKRGLGPINDFTYESADDAGPSRGEKCPFHAHVRKMNPRGDHEANLPHDPRSRLPVRRSIPYGERTLAPGRVLEPDAPAPESPVGLHFMCFVRDIDVQFEHLLSHWANRADFPHASVGPDPLIGQTPGIAGQRVIWPKGRTGNSLLFPSCVTTRGGAYLFAPSRKFFSSL